MEVSARGKAVGQVVAGIAAQGPLAVEIQLKTLYAPLLAHPAMPSGMAGIMPKESIASPLTEIVGTGPYRLKERKPDQYTVLAVSTSTRRSSASGYAGKREALLDELRFVPVPNATTRLEGALAGQFHYADLLQVESMGRLDKAGPAWCRS
ncbi:ABC transporter substrate-binding protein OS=Castellaniella sp OX=1955812 GN=EPN31_11440 PE=4 SV=1 [Castellaniella denitrificans]